jgi:hypothetical protein
MLEAVMGAPLLVHLMFHPSSSDARKLAGALHHALNDDAAVPGLRVPTALLAEDGTALPPDNLDLDEAEHSVAVVLADDHMVLEDGVPEDRRSWPAFVADVADRCADGQHRFLPVQLTEAAWPLHEKLQQTNFIRGHLQTEDTRLPWLERRLVIEICRFLLGHDRGDQAPVKVFLSHAKQDIKTGPKLFEELVAHLNATQPVSAWVDSAQIEAGKDFAGAIEKGVSESAVLVLATASYSSRPWCRREVLFAKAHACPLVVADGLDGLDTRSFPYAGNVPVVAWGAGGAQRAVDLLLKEQLRHLHSNRLLERQRQPEDCIRPTPPELATIVALPKERPILYPDPPLGDEELEVLAHLGHRVETPLQRAASRRSLSAKKVAVSISESDSPQRVGMLREHLDDALLEISRHLLVRGASLAYGGHLGGEGYTVALFDLVRAHQQMSGVPPVDRIVNYVGWPLPNPTVAQRARYKDQATFVRVARPEGIEALDPKALAAEPAFFPADTPERRYAWARGMTRMREQQTAETAARIALGGKVGPTVTATPAGGKKESWYMSRIPGVVEEILLSLQAGKPLYLCGAFGGAAALAIDLLSGKAPPEFTWDYQKQAPHAEAMRALYEKQGVAWLDYPDMARIFKDAGVAGLSRANGLSEEENQELFRTRDLPRLIELLLLGLTRKLGEAGPA